RVLQYLERQDTQPARLMPAAVEGLTARNRAIPTTRFPRRRSRANGACPPEMASATTALAQQLVGLDICQITPLQALSLLHHLHQQARTVVGHGEVST